MRIHFIAIGGSAMHNLAIALCKKGYHVTGSDDVIFEPAKSRLDKYNLLPETLGWNPENITANIDAVILGMHARVDNPELLTAQKLGLKIYSYPEYIYEQSKNKKRVVIGGSHGKTTITSMILHVLNYYNQSFDYLVGAQLAGFDTMVQLSDAPIIIIEGDEYLASPIDRRPKFHLYKAHIGVISGIAWDHINVFPSFKNYTDQFDIFINTIETGGALIYCEKDADLVEVVKQNNAQITKIPYTIPAHKIKNGITYLKPENTPLQIFGDHNLMNLNAAKLVCEQLNINATQFYIAIAGFTGAAKRLEVISSDELTNVYKDFAHSPSKLKATIQAVKNQFNDRRLIACIELHTFSSLNKDFLKEYAASMDAADDAIVFIDLKSFEQKQMPPFSETDVKEAFANPNLKFFNQADDLKKYILSIIYNKANLLMMSSGNYAGFDLPKLATQLLK